MEFPQTVIDAVNKAIKKHPESVEDAVDCAERSIRSLDDFEGLVATLIRSCVQDLVYDARHRSNVRERQLGGDYGQQAKVSVGESGSVNDAYASMFRYFVGGTIIAKVSGADLDGLIESEMERSQGHLFNARLCRLLRKKTPDEKRVEEVLTDRQFARIFKLAEKKEESGEAA